MDTTPRLKLPYIASQQAQKQVTYNEAMQALDVLVQPAVKSRTLANPPGAPVTGDSYIVAAGGTGAWAGRDGEIATYADDQWVFHTPADGWLAYIDDVAEIAVCQAGAWSSLVTNGGASVAKFGVNATADLTNRLVSAAEATLLTHDGAGHRLTINKAASGDTASLVFQTGYSGRAEFGLAGDDDWHVKVSPDGTNWIEALVVDRATGAVTAAGGVTAPRLALDANGGLEFSGSNPRLTLDSGDTLTYDRTNNQFQFAIGGTTRAALLATAFRPAVDNAMTCGASGLRWSAIWSANGTIQTSDGRQKTEVEPSSLGLGFIEALRPVSYKWRVGGNAQGEDEVVPVPGRRRHFGLIAQEVKAVLDAQGIADFGGYVKADSADPDSEEGLRYDQFIAPLIAAIQALSSRCAALEARVAALEEA